ncbi:MAG TPA: hypothetical protein VN408_35440, partial [Actinoplanes sp.]|nr:hypothetical protein [Actinoplanes sp.]
LVRRDPGLPQQQPMAPPGQVPIDVAHAASASAGSVPLLDGIGDGSVHRFRGGLRLPVLGGV